MAKRKIQTCDLCEGQHLTAEAEKWCPQCEEALCSKCKISHGIARLTKTHQTIAVEEYAQLPDFVRQVKQHCGDHGERFEYFCAWHDTPCCVKCLKSRHKLCHEYLAPLHEVVTNAKTSKDAIDLVKLTKDLTKNLEKMLDVQSKNMEELNRLKVQCKTEIKDWKKKQLEHLDQLEKDLIAELSSIYEKHSLQMSAVHNDLTLIMEETSDTMKQMSSLNQYASDIQAFFCIRSIKEKLNDKEQTIKSLLDSKKIVYVQVHLDKNTKECNAIINLPKLILDVKPENLNYTSEMAHEAQIFTRNQKDISKLSLKKKFQLRMPENIGSVSKVFDCHISEKGQYIVSNVNEKRLEIFQDGGEYIRAVELSFSPLCFTHWKNTKELVILGKNGTIYFCDHDEFILQRQVDVTPTPNSLTVCNENILIGIKGVGFRIIDPYGNILKEIQAELIDPHYTTFVKDTIYFTNWKEGRVVGIDMQGNILHEIRNDGLRGPVGISSDEEGNLFISGFRSNNVMLFCRDRRQIKEIISSTNQTSNIRSIHYSSFHDSLLIASEDGKVFVYESSFV